MSRRTLKNDFLELEYLTGPLRISGLIPFGKPNMLVDLGDLPPIPTPYGDFHFLGGHRLWHAPEAMPRTYELEAGELAITDIPGGVVLETRTDPGTGIRKRIEIHLVPDKPSVTLTHTLINDGLWSVELSPWAITQFRLGGTIILPMPVGSVDPAGLLHNRQISLWSYARINDPRMKWGDAFSLLKADAALPPFKMGYFNTLGWEAYWLEDVLFRKSFAVQSGLPHPDNNCNAETYINDRFVELESLGPLTKLNPGELLNHVEIWDLFEGMDVLPGEIREGLQSLKPA